MNGVLWVDKPLCISSHDAVQCVKKKMGAQKAGHLGTLDPLATGMLMITMGEASRFSKFFLNLDKQYQFRLRFGVATDTGDAEGKVITTCERIPSESDVRSVLHDFIGDIQQIPPMYSALKQKGVPLYRWARQGVIVDRLPRPVTIMSLDWISAPSKTDVVLRVHCGKGTYVRTLAEDIAKKLGTCAHVVELRRWAIGPYTHMVPMDEIDSSHLQSVDTLLQHIPVLMVPKPVLFYLHRGMSLDWPYEGPPGHVRLYDRDTGEFKGMGLIDAHHRMLKADGLCA